MSQEFSIVGNLLLKVDGAEAGLNKLKNSLSKLEMPKGLENSFKKSFSNLDDIFARYKKQLEKGFDSKTDVSNITKIGKELDSELTKVSNHLTKLTGEKVDFKIDTAPVKQATKDLEDILEKRRQLVQEKLEFKIDSPKEGIDNIKQLLEEFKRVTGDTKAGRAVGNALFQLETGDLEKALSFLKEAENNLGRIGDKKKEAFSSTGFTLSGALETVIKELSTTDGELTTVSDKAKLFQDILAQAQAGQLKDVDALLEKISQGFTKNASSAREAAKAAQDYAQSTVSMKDQVKQLQQSTQYFFSLRNMINLFKRGVREAVDTIKQLDAAMTETAVVTKFSVSDMWAKLPEYTANANALGATVQDMYESTTLYYQQGLDTQQAMGIAAETMKMARIAGLEAADATDMMTAALRGFNMELNETSAQRINDVYSNLAAKTASNTEELGTAMQRTASIAHSAGMSFEGTAAFLAQAIETTREPAENIGTAMKTIVARFQEMKKNPLEIADVEGEEVSFNKVDDALKTIGVDLKDTNGQFRDLDKVFLDISQKWDGLSQTQQRYIATVAAGSRQQSRFIAMMSDYDRTMELMGYANNSAGASTTQFNKTLDSLEAKINKFQNAWKQFLMGIMNDSWTKKVVDAGTSILNIVNKIIDTLSFGGKLKGVKSLLSTFTAFTALKMTGRGANALIGGLGGMVDPQSSFRAGAQGGAIGRNSAQAINQPIVKELQSIRSLIATKINANDLNKTNIKGPYDEYNRLKEARAGISQLKGQGTIGDLTKQLSGLSRSSQNLLMDSNAGTFRSATNAIIDAYGSKNRAAVRKGERWLNNERKSARLTAEEYFTALQDPGLLKDAMLRAGIQKNNPAYEYMKGLDDAVTTRASELRDSARKTALKQANEKDYDRINGLFNSDKVKEKYRKLALKEQEENNQLPGSQTKFERSNWGKALDGIGKIGSGISQAGMGIQAFGSILTSSANPALQMFGSALTSIGGLVSGLGMGISGLAAGFTALASSSAMEAAASGVVTIAKRFEATSSLTVAGAATALTGILFALVAVIAGVAWAIKKHRENIKKDAEEVTTKYKDKSSENQSNIANLKQWKSELAVLSKGVDENGYNINLDPSDYEHYLEIVDGIAKMNPEIVQGYNAQGHAIIDNNRALEKTLSLEEQRSKSILRDYTNTDSLTKLLKARNLERSHYAGGGAGDNYIETIEYELKPRTDMRHEMSKIGSELRRNKDLIDLSKLDIDIDALARGEEAEFQKVLSNYDTFKQLVSESIDRAGDEWGDKSREAIEQSFSSFEEYGADLDELVQPVYEALSAAASQTSGFQEMADNLKIPFQNALKELATNGQFEDGKEIDKAAKNMATKFAGYSEAYIDAMDKVDRANKQFALDFNEQEYDANTEDAINELNDLKSTLEDTPEGHAISEWIDQEIEKIQKHLSTGTKSIEEAWDTFSDNIAVAESALDNFNKKTEKDFYSAADDMQKIFETVMDPDAYHTIGYGDNTFWTGAESLLGQKNIMNKTKDEVVGMMKAIEPFLKEGPEGVQNFANKVDELSPKLEKIAGVEMEDGWFKSIDENVNPEVWGQIADKLKISEDLLVSMINKSRQFKQWDFSDMPAVREAYSIDESVIHGTKQSKVTTTDETGKETTVKADTLYITDTELRSRMGADYYQKDLRESKTEALKQQGIEVLPEHLNKLTAQMMKNEMGIADWNAAIKTFGDTGVFDKSEIYDAAKILKEDELGRKLTAEEESNFQKEFSEGWTSWLESYEDPIVDPVNTIASDVAAIAGKLVGESSADKKEKDSKSETPTDKQDKTPTYGSKVGTEGTTIPGVGFVPNQSTKTPSPSPYSPEQKALYSDNHLLAGLFNGLKNAITESAQKRQAQEDAYKNVQGKNADQAQQESKDWWSNLSSLINTSLNDKTGYTTGNQPESTTPQQTDNNSTIDNEALTQVITQLTAGIEPLSTAGESLNTAASNLTSAAETLSTSEQNKDVNPSSNNSEVPSIEVIAAIKEVTPPTEEPTIPVKANLEVEGNTGNGGFLSKLFGGKKDGPSIDVAANITSINANEQSQTISVIGNITKITATTTANSIDATAVVTQVTKSGQVAGEPIKVQATATTTKVENKTQNEKVSAGTQTINVTANTSAAQAKINQLISLFNKTYTLKYTASGPRSISVPISANFTGSWQKTVTINKSGAKGINNQITYPSMPSFGSAAKGRRGMIGPTGKGGLTLTGEKGYEVAWLPSENRSMVLGANGPQMLELPSDAVVWDHEQSKKILKQKSIPAGSQATATSSGGWNFSGWSGGGSSGGGGAAKAVGKAANHVKKKATETANVVQKVSVWWENIARKTEVAQRQQDKNQKAFEKYIKEMRATLQFTGESLESGGGGGDDYLKSIGETLGYYEAQLEKVTSELSELNEGTEAQIKASEKVQAAKDTKTKKDDKKAKKELAKANKKAYEDNASSAAKVSYKKGKKTKEEIVNLAPYIKEEDGTFVIDQKKLDTIDNKDKRKAVADAANKEINDRLSKKYKIEDEIQKAQDAIEKFGEELYETFFKWENELTKIWNITQKIEQSEAKISRAKSYQDLLDSQIATGSKKIIDNKKNDTGLRAEMLGVFNAGLTQLTQEIHSQVGLLGEQKNHLQNLLNITDERKTLDNVQKKLVGNVRNKNLNDTEVAGYEKYAAELEKAIDAQTQAWKYLSVNKFSDGTIQVDFDTKTFETDKENGEITGDLGKAIQDYVKELTDANKELNSQYETIITKTTEMNDQLKTLQEQWVGYADELWQISNEEQKKQVDNLKKVSDSITNTLKNLLDDVKRKLDQRRKEEDNAKTEKGISQKQQRLAALQADTSGGHQVEIAQLQQEIADEQQNYQRSLEDQLLDNLQQQADVAAQQREQQIALQEATITAVNNAALVNQWMDDPLKYRDTIFEAYKTANDFDEKPKALQDDLIKKFESMFAGLATNKDEQQATQDALKDLNTEREGVVNVLETIKQSVDAITIPSSIEVQSTGANADIKPGNTQAKIEQEQKAVQEEENKRKAEEDKKQAEEEQQQAIAAAQKKYNDFLYNRGDSKSKDKNKGKIGKDGYLQQVARGATLGKSEYQVAKELADTKELTWKEILTAAKKAGKKAKTVKNWNPKADKKSKFRQAFEKVYGKWSKYASGGMADFTGPAWLDGTPSKPELVLNSTDTKNFVALKDVLAKVMNGVGAESSTIGDITYEININVDKIEKDYDVDKVIDKVKKEITKSAGYRNVTQIRNLR